MGGQESKSMENVNEIISFLSQNGLNEYSKKLMKYQSENNYLKIAEMQTMYGNYIENEKEEKKIKDKIMANMNPQDRQNLLFDDIPWGLFFCSKAPPQIDSEGGVLCVSVEGRGDISDHTKKLLSFLSKLLDQTNWHILIFVSEFIYEQQFFKQMDEKENVMVVKFIPVQGNKVQEIVKELEIIKPFLSSVSRFVCSFSYPSTEWIQKAIYLDLNNGVESYVLCRYLMQTTPKKIIVQSKTGNTKLMVHERFSKLVYIPRKINHKTLDWVMFGNQDFILNYYQMDEYIF